MTRDEKDEALENRGFLLGISEGLFTAMRFLNERSGECYKRRDDRQSALYRQACDEIAKLASEARARYDKEYPNKHRVTSTEKARG